MPDLHQLAVEAVEARCEGSLHENECLKALEAVCSREDVKRLITRAEAIVLPPLMPRVLRVLKRAAKSDRRGDGERAAHLQALACRWVGFRTVEKIVAEQGLGLKIYARPGRDEQGLIDPRVDTVDNESVRHGFAVA